MRKHRHIETNLCYHLMNRMAHRAFFLTPDERSRAIDLMRRAETFSGVQVLAYSFMTNHFHIYTYVPDPADIDDDEILHRVKTLYRGASLNVILDEWMHLQDEERLSSKSKKRHGNDQVLSDSRFAELKRKLLQRMWNSSEFMRTFKQHFTMSYNGRHEHSGTMWECRYVERHHKPRNPDMSRTAAYIDSNAVKAGLASSAQDYEWCSFAAACHGDVKARRGYEFIYGSSVDWETVRQMHESAIGESAQEAQRNLRLSTDGTPQKESNPSSAKDPGLGDPSLFPIELERGHAAIAVKVLELLADGPQTSASLRDAVGIGSGDYFTRTYLRPLLELGKIERTIPSNPRAQKQMYRLVPS